MCKRHESAILAQGQGHTIQTFLSYLVTFKLAWGSVKNLNIKLSFVSIISSSIQIVFETAIHFFVN